MKTLSIRMLAALSPHDQLKVRAWALSNTVAYRTSMVLPGVYGSPAIQNLQVR